MSVLVIFIVMISTSLQVHSWAPPLTNSYVSKTSSSSRRRSVSSLQMTPNKGFDPQPNEGDMEDPVTTSTISTSTSSSYVASRSGQEVSVEFELQELKAQLKEMEKRKLTAKYLTPEVRDILASYAKALAFSPSPIPLTTIGKWIPNTKWRLAFTTNAVALGDLPRDVQISLDIYPENVDDNSKKLDYILTFPEYTFGIRDLRAKCSYQVDEGLMNPGLLTFVYDEIVTTLFGKKVGVGFFGLLKGRSNYVESAYYDDALWIDRGFSPDGVEYFNVYTRIMEDENDSWNR